MTKHFETNYTKFSTRNQETASTSSLIVDDLVLEGGDSVKILGIHLDKELTWNVVIDSLCVKRASGIFALRSLTRFSSSHVQCTAYAGIWPFVPPYLVQV